MSDNFGKYISQLNSPGKNAQALTESDTVDLAHTTRYVYVGGAGDITCILSGDTAEVTFKAVPVGTILPIRIKRLMVATTATLLIGIY